MQDDPSDSKFARFNRERINDRNINELIGIAKGVLADGIVTHDEADYLHKWLIACSSSWDNPICNHLIRRISVMLKDNVLDEEEQKELFSTLTQFTGGSMERGELHKPTTLPLDHPEPEVIFKDKVFTFTGTFAFGTRNDCHKVIHTLGGSSSNLTLKTNYLVIGNYVTDSWKHTNFGRKIEKASEWKSKRKPIAIIRESHWLKFIGDYRLTE